MTTSARHLLLAAAVCLLAGCATTPGPSKALFLLQQPHPAASGDPSTPHSAGGQPVLVLPDISLAPYLMRDGIIYQTGPNRIVEADNNRWAAPLAVQTTVGLYQALDRGLSSVDVRRPALAEKPSYRLIVSIARFQGRYDGKAVISGNWRLFDRKDRLVGSGDFVQTTPLQTDGYAALVRALSRGWRTIKQNMVRAVGNLLADIEKQPESGQAATAS